MAEELLVVLNRKDHTGFGFSLLGKPGLPPIIYNILEDSPAAESGEVEVGDAILKVNETDVNRLSTKEVLKCLRLSSDPVTLKIKRDPKIKATVRKHLLSSNVDDNNLRGGGNNKGGNANIFGGRNLTGRPEPAVHKSHARTNGSCPANNPEQEPLLHLDKENDDDAGNLLQWQPLAAGENVIAKRKPKFEAYMMTGEHILNISRTPPQSANNIIGPNAKQKKFQVDNLRYHNSHQLRPHHHQQQHQHHNSVPNSPNEMDLGLKNHHCKSGANSANTSPVGATKWDGHPSPGAGDASKSYGGGGGGGYVRTSRSEDQLQGQHDPSSVGGADVDDDDMTSSLNTLLDTRPESVAATGAAAANASGSGGDSDRIVWTYNAPNSDHRRFGHTLSNGSSHSSSSPTSSSSPAHSGSPASPTSVSSSVMSSSGSRRTPCAPLPPPNGGDCSVSEAVSNISSPDYHDDDSMGIRECDNMQISDQSDSDSTLLVSEPRQKTKGRGGGGGGADGDHRIVIQVKGPDKDGGKGLCCDTSLKNRIDSYGYQISYEVSEQTYELDEEHAARECGKSSSPHSSEDESDVESLHSFHYSPKAVDLPSAIRLAKRLYCLDGFKKSDVSRHLSKNNDFSRAVAEEYLKYFAFENDTLDTALRKFLKQFSLTGETQERERVLVHFSKRYLDCNPGSFNSQDAVHTLTCAIMLLNTDLHGQNINRKMTCNEFIENLAGLNECENFPREVLKHLYHAIKNYPLEWALDEDVDEATAQMQKTQEQLSIGGNPFLDVPISSNAIEYKKGYVMRKCCYESDAKKSLCCVFLARFHKRSWKMFYCTLRDLVLYLHKDENGFKKNQMGDNFHNAIRIHHALATKASDYTKKQFVFRLQTADQAEYLFQTSDSRELQSWIDTINFICASFSARPLEAAVGSQKKFQRPLLPCSLSKLNLRDQLRDHEERVHRLEVDLEEHRKSPPEKGSKSLVVQNYKEKEHYLTYEVKRYRTYAYMLRSRISQYPEPGVSLIENSIGEVDEATGVTLMDSPSGGIVPPPIPDRPSPSTNRRSPSD